MLFSFLTAKYCQNYFKNKIHWSHCVYPSSCWLGWVPERKCWSRRQEWGKCRCTLRVWMRRFICAYSFFKRDFAQGPNLGLTVLGVDQVGLEGEFVFDRVAAWTVASALAALVLAQIRTQHQVATNGLKFLSSFASRYAWRITSRCKMDHFKLHVSCATTCFVDNLWAPKIIAVNIMCSSLLHWTINVFIINIILQLNAFFIKICW